MEMCSENEIIAELSRIMKDKSLWNENYSFVRTLLKSEFDKIKAKALWVYGEIGFKYPEYVADGISDIALALHSKVSLIRERSLHALGRIGRADFSLVEPYLDEMLSIQNDPSPNVRLNLIWAAENIATTTPAVFENRMDFFVKFLDDSDDKVRMEAPEIFRVMAKKCPHSVQPYIKKLKCIADSDLNPVVRIHATGAIKAVKNEH